MRDRGGSQVHRHFIMDWTMSSKERKFKYGLAGLLAVVEADLDAVNKERELLKNTIVL